MTSATRSCKKKFREVRRGEEGLRRATFSFCFFFFLPPIFPLGLNGGVAFFLPLFLFLSFSSLTPQSASVCLAPGSLRPDTRVRRRSTLTSVLRAGPRHSSVGHHGGLPRARVPPSGTPVPPAVRPVPGSTDPTPPSLPRSRGPTEACLNRERQKLTVFVKRFSPLWIRCCR